MFSQVFETTTQVSLIRISNELVDLLPKHPRLKKFDEEGICNGLTYCYALYALTGRRDEFRYYLQFLDSLGNKKGRVAFEEAYKKNPNKFEKFLQFLMTINCAQHDTSLNQIKANWDKTYSFNCHSTALSDWLTVLNPGDFVFFRLGVHIFCIEKVPEGFYLFEPKSFYTPLHLQSISPALNIWFLSRG